MNKRSAEYDVRYFTIFKWLYADFSAANCQIEISDNFTHVLNHIIAMQGLWRKMRSDAIRRLKAV